MARICQVTGKRGNNAKHIRNQHSKGWKYKAPHKNRTQEANLQVVHLMTPHGKVSLKVSTKALKSPAMSEVLCGLKPMPKDWLKKISY